MTYVNVDERIHIYIIVYCIIPILFLLNKLTFISRYDIYNGKITHMTETPISVIYNDGYHYNSNSATNNLLI
jgi:hypothetical protein